MHWFPWEIAFWSCFDNRNPFDTRQTFFLSVPETCRVNLYCRRRKENRTDLNLCWRTNLLRLTRWLSSREVALWSCRWWWSTICILTSTIYGNKRSRTQPDENTFVSWAANSLLDYPRSTSILRTLEVLFKTAHITMEFLSIAFCGKRLWATSFFEMKEGQENQVVCKMHDGDSELDGKRCQVS